MPTDSTLDPEDRIKGRLDEDQEQLLEVASPLGFELRQPRTRPLEDLKLKSFETPTSVSTRLSGKLNGVPIDVYEYGWVTQGKHSRSGNRIVLVLRDPSFEGEAHCTWETFQSIPAKIFQWTLIAFVLVAAFYIIIPILLYQWWKGGPTLGSDHSVGNEDFDTCFRVDGPTKQEAQRALPLAMQELVMDERLKGPIDIRPGHLALAIDAERLDAQTFTRAIAIAKRVLELYSKTKAPPPTAYRVAEQRDAPPLEAEEIDQTTEEDADGRRRSARR